MAKRGYRFIHHLVALSASVRLVLSTFGLFDHLLPRPSVRADSFPALLHRSMRDLYWRAVGSTLQYCSADLCTRFICLFADPGLDISRCVCAALSLGSFQMDR